MSLRIILGLLLVAVVALGVAAYQTIRWAEAGYSHGSAPSSKVVVIRTADVSIRRRSA